ncbi:MAG: hypothetical protein MI919_39215, partial [Holophagales bacterium]|nr:hypothetical protein [Holophagales bacterium]
NKSIDVYLVNKYWKSCKKIKYRQANSRPYQTKNNEFSINNMLIDMLSRPDIVQEPRKGYRSKLKNQVHKHKFSSTVNPHEVGPKTYWGTVSQTRICAQQAVYTSGRTECRRYINAGTAVFAFTVDRAHAERIAGRACTE